MNRFLMVLIVIVATVVPASAQITLKNRRGSVLQEQISDTEPNRKAAHVVLDRPFDRDDTDLVIGTAADLGVTMLRLQFDWGRVENTEGVFTWSGTTGAGGNQIADYDYLFSAADTFNIKLVLQYFTCPSWANGSNSQDNQGPPQDFAKWGTAVTALVHRYKPGGTYGLTRRILYGVEVFNEPNNSGGEWKVWGGASFAFANEPARWAAMVNQTITSVHAEDPDTKVISGPLCTSLGVDCDNAEAWDTYMDTALLTMNAPDAVGWNGYYTTATTAAQMIADIGPKLSQLRTKINATSWPSATTKQIWCMECGSANANACAANQSALVTSMYAVDGVHDQLKIDPRYVTRFFYRLLLDTATVTIGTPNTCETGFGCGGLVFYAPQFPALTPCSVAAGYAKPAYATFKNMPSTP